MKFIHPFSAIVAGSSGTGKTMLVRSLLEDYRVTTTIDKSRLKVWWCHGQDQSVHQQQIPGVDVSYIRDFVSDFSDDKPDIIIYDDLMSEIAGKKELADVHQEEAP